MCADSTRTKGGKGEELARLYLKKKGYQILSMNFRVRIGEIDIIARDHETIVFVEVKAASGTRFGDAISWVPYWKQKRIVKVSQVYLSREGLYGSPARFDVVAVDPEKKVYHVRDAFRVSDDIFV